jgi:hypothetical protein
MSDGSGFYVHVKDADSEPQRVGNFATVAEAARWISNQTLDRLRVDRPTSY